MMLLEDQAVAQARRSGPALPPRSPARRLAPLLALPLAVAAIACESTSSTSIGPSPVKCQVSLAPSPSSIDAGGGKVAVTVSTQPECSWTASSGAGWITGLTPSSGQGSGQIEFQAAANPAGAVRQGNVAVNDQHVSIQQNAAPCRFQVTPATQTVEATGGIVTFAVNTLVGCNWQASVAAGWVAITNTSGTGSGNVSLRVDANGGPARNTSLLVAGERATLTQSSSVSPPSRCTYSINPTKQSIDSDGGSGRPVAVSAPTGCGWTATSNDSWITVTSGSAGSGNGTVRFNVASNSGKKRTGTLTVASRTFTVDQDKD